MKKIIEFKLKILAKIILAKYKPDVIGVTGSVGKTGAKDAIYAVLSSSFNVRKSEKNYNNEFGVPLTVIGSEAQGRSLSGWFMVFFYAVKIIFFRDKNYPEILILEMGADRPGDIKYLNGVVKCRVGVITRIGESHLEFFGTKEKVREEKELLIKGLGKSGWAVLNRDDEEFEKISKSAKSKIISFGFNKGADILASEIGLSFFGENKIENLRGVSFKASFNGSSVPILLPGVVSFISAYSALAATAIGIIYDMNLIKISDALRSLKPTGGRMNLIRGIKNSLIIDDTYNSSPQSSIAALEMFTIIPTSSGAKKIVAMGEMLELGDYSVLGHREVGREVCESKADLLITVGERARDIGRGAEEAGMEGERIFHFPNSDDAGVFVQERLKKNDLVLVKGSQRSRMEKVVKEIMAEPNRAEELLVRQGGTWANR